jgi:hypothetical protein
MSDAFLREQLEILRQLNERVAKIQREVNQNGELLINNRAISDRLRAHERLYRQRDPRNDRRKAERTESDSDTGSETSQTSLEHAEPRRRRH